MNASRPILDFYDQIKPLARWSVSVLFVIYQLFLQFSMGVLILPMRREFHFSNLEISLISISFYMVYIPMQIPSGVLIDKYGSKRLIQSGALVCALGCMLLSLSQHLLMIIIARALMGAGASCAFVSCVKITKTSFALKHITLMLGIAETAMMIGTMIGESSLAHLVVMLNWRQSLRLLALVGLVISVLSHQCIPNPNIFKVVAKKNNLTQIIRNSKLWWHGLYIGLMFSPISVWASTWAIPYVMKKQSLEFNKAVLEVSFCYLGMAVMSPVLGCLIQAFNASRKWYFCALLMLLMIALLMMYADSLSFMLACFLCFFLGACASITVLNYAEVAAKAVKHQSSQTVGFVNAVALTVIPILHLLMGLIIKD